MEHKVAHYIPGGVIQMDVQGRDLHSLRPITACNVNRWLQRVYFGIQPRLIVFCYYVRIGLNLYQSSREEKGTCSKIEVIQ